MTSGNTLIPDSNLPAHYEQLLQGFGKLCINALKCDKFYFTKDEIRKLVPDTIRNDHDNVIMGFLIKSNVSLSRSRGRKTLTDCYQPLHKTFLEFVSAYYLRKLAEQTEDQAELKAVLSSLQDIETNSLEQILLYTVEMLQDKAFVVLKELSDIGLNGTGNLR